jgi:hypothetical protein
MQRMQRYFNMVVVLFVNIRDIGQYVKNVAAVVFVNTIILEQDVIYATQMGI